MFGVRKPYKGINPNPRPVQPPEEETKKKPKYFQK